MWFKQAQIFKLGDTSEYAGEKLTEKLEQLLFSPCLPSMPDSVGWVSPIDEEGAPLTRTVNGYHMICLKMEERILPAAVIRKEVEEVVRQIEASESRKLKQKEKHNLKDEVILTLMPRAFTKVAKVYAYIDTKNQWLILGTGNGKMTDKFLSVFKKSVTDDVRPLEVQNLSSTMTNWIKHKNYPSIISVEKACLLQDPGQENRTIRCQHQDLFVNGIQSLIKDGCAVIQLALSWHDRVNFVLVNDFSFRSIQYQDDIKEQAKELEPESKQQQLDADFLIMSETLSSLIKEMVDIVISAGQPVAMSA